jgi:hypothetical protein
MKDEWNPHNLPPELITALGEWTMEGRTEEQIYGVQNFLTGKGGLAIKKLLEARAELLSELARDIEKEFDTKFPTLKCDEYLNGVGKSDNNHWLEYGMICQHDDYCLCERRFGFVKDSILDLIKSKQ